MKQTKVVEDHDEEKHCKHEQAVKIWLETDHSPGIHCIVLGEKYRYNCPDCKASWEAWE